MKSSKLIACLLICLSSFSVISQESAVILSFERFNLNTKSSLSNHWSWLSLNYYRPTRTNFSYAVGINVNTSYILAKAPNQLFNPIPRGKKIHEKIGLNGTLYYKLKSFNNDIHWFLSSQWSLNSTYIYRTVANLDSTTNQYVFSNQFSDKTLIFRADIGVTLRARINDPFFFEFRPAYQFMNRSDIDKTFRFKGQVSLVYRLKNHNKKEETPIPISSFY